jgi:hypothetical protein
MSIFECGTAAFRFSFCWAAGLEQAEAEVEGETRESVRPCNER